VPAPINSAIPPYYSHTRQNGTTPEHAGALEDKPHALAAVKAFGAAYGAKFPKATAKITDDADELLAFYDYPCEHWGVSTHDQPDRVDFRHGQAPHQDH